MFTKAHQWAISWVRSFQSTPSLPNHLESITALSSNLRLRLLPWSFVIEITYLLHVPSVLGEEYKITKLISMYFSHLFNLSKIQISSLLIYCILFLEVWCQDSHPYKATGAIKILYLFVFLQSQCSGKGDAKRIPLSCSGAKKWRIEFLRKKWLSICINSNLHKLNTHTE
jgi:hypothetical protein